MTQLSFDVKIHLKSCFDLKIHSKLCFEVENSIEIRFVRENSLKLCFYVKIQTNLFGCTFQNTKFKSILSKSKFYLKRYKGNL